MDFLKERGATGRNWDVINNDQELRFKFHPEFFISSKPDAIAGLAIAARKAPSDPPYARQILEAIYNEFGPSEEFRKELGKFEKVSKDAIGPAASKYFKEHNTPFLEQGGILKKAKENIQKENVRVYSRFKRIIMRVDPYFALAGAAVEPVTEAYSVEMRSVVDENGIDRWTPDSIPRGKDLDSFIREKIIKHTAGSQFELEERSRNIKRAVESGSSQLFTRPNLELSISKERIKEDLYAHLHQDTTSDSEVLADVLEAYRTALTYIASEGRNSYEVVDHWREVRKTGKPADFAGDENDKLEKTVSFDRAFRKVVERHRADAGKASIVVRQALGPIMARMIEEKAQFIGETFPLHPGKVIFYDEGKRKLVSLPQRLREEVERQKKVQTSGELQQAQQRQVIMRGEILLQIVEDCRKLFAEVTPEKMEAMYPLLTAGAVTSERNETALALSQAAQSSGDIANNLDKIFAAKVEFSVPEGADALLQELAKTLGIEISFEYTSLGTKKKVKIPGVEMYRLLQDKSTPDILKRKIASFVLRKFVGYPPDLNKTPDILGGLSLSRRQELIDFRNRIPPSDPFFDLTTDKDFRPEEARKIIKLRLKGVHPDVNEDSQTKREATFLYNEMNAYMDVLGQEQGKGIWESMRDI